VKNGYISNLIQPKLDILELPYSSFLKENDDFF